MGEWTKCSSSCQPGVQHRTVYCQEVAAGGRQSVISDDICVNAHGPKPSSSQDCNQDAVCPEFHIGEWSPVSPLLGH